MSQKNKEPQSSNSVTRSFTSVSTQINDKGILSQSASFVHCIFAWQKELNN